MPLSKPRANRGGSVTWRVQFRINGKVAQESFDTQNAGDEFGRLVDRVGGAAARAARDARDASNAGAPTLAEFTAQYLDPNSGMLTGITESTREGYVGIAARSFLRVMGEIPVDAIQKEDVGRWVQWQEAQPSNRRAGQNTSAKTVRNYHAVLSAVLQAAVPKIRLDNPAHKTKLSRGESREGVFLTTDEFATLLHFVNPYYKPLVLFLVATGCRWGEATALPWGNVELKMNPPLVHIRVAWKKGARGAPELGVVKTKMSKRSVSLTPDLVASLPPRGAGDELVFKPRQQGQHIWYGRFRTTIWDKAVAKANDAALCKAAGMVPIGKWPTPHDLRHTHASWLISEGAPLPYVQARLGHENISTTVGIYGHVMPEGHYQMATIMQRVMQDVQPISAAALLAIE